MSALPTAHDSPLDRGAVDSLAPPDDPDRSVLEQLVAIDSEEAYRAALGRRDLWVAVAAVACRREGIDTHGLLEHLRIDGRYPAVIVSPDLVVKIYGPWANGAAVRQVELSAHAALGRDLWLQVPRLIAHGQLSGAWDYLVLTRIPGTKLVDVLYALDADALRDAVAWIGRFVRQLHAVPLTWEERKAAWERFTRYAADLHRDAPARLAAHAALPPRLLQQVRGWLPPPEELLCPAERFVVTHGDLSVKHVLGHLVGSRFYPAGVVDLNDSLVGDPLIDLGKLWWCSFRGDRGLLAAFLAEARLPGAGGPDFPRHALAWALMRTCTYPPTLPGIELVRDLDELALRSFGSLAG